MLQYILRYIDENIREELSVSILAEGSGIFAVSFQPYLYENGRYAGYELCYQAEAAICPLRFVTGKESGGCRSGIWF